MTAPGGASGESAGGDETHSSPTGEQPPWQSPWESPAPPPGYGPPPGYYPPPDYPGSYGPQGAYRLEGQPRMNGLAIASLVSSFTGLFCCIGGILAIVLGAIALGQIKRTRQDGYALAVAGIVIGVAALIVNLVVAVFALQR